MKLLETVCNHISMITSTPHMLPWQMIRSQLSDKNLRNHYSKWDHSWTLSLMFKHKFMTLCHSSRMTVAMKCKTRSRLVNSNFLSSVRLSSCACKNLRKKISRDKRSLINGRFSRQRNASGEAKKTKSTDCTNSIQHLDKRKSVQKRQQGPPKKIQTQRNKAQIER